MQVTVDELVTLIGKQAIELDRLRRELAARAEELAAANRHIEALEAPRPKGGDGT